MFGQGFCLEVGIHAYLKSRLLISFPHEKRNIDRFAVVPARILWNLEVMTNCG